MPKRGKKYLEVVQKVDRDRYYTPLEAIKLVKEVSYTAFDGTVELHLRMGLDPRRSEQQIRGVVRLPYGLGKPVRVLVFAAGEDAQIAQNAGADFIIADDEGIQKIMDGWVDFDVAIAVPDMMRKVGRLGRVLGRRGLMPTPKTGTVVQPEDLPRVIDEAKAGRVEYRLDRTANIHCPIGKVSFPEEQLLGNLAAIMDAIRRAKPSAAKGIYVKRVTLAPSMGPGVRVDTAQALELESAK
ncbi:MAG TPA: 50S ribosomal protein L1 [Anaerolineae bacterium]|nr:50S ribosomal protein L1 [Anaerolineae bacterium]HQI85452.1 50S ribosomal protein L1 [Anaerolineae bacterium]